ncbi:MarR family winged helix-turn-helix transcriptional regulator [Acinetobacter sp. DSM 11652]|uniref:MarR family winged helix-turn-helix transcriptional regulator n=1 Tax=Acinetobacter sp. DSM 11652 TaxID=346222 RepID=UPI0008B1E756|nr:MarR family transcriptional regulator [Acinetobacter sp. DSM 11652]SEL41297.1 DNA-binding transcriptional regulator, MarR family [Acinetobacter sp. DSM 11652]
MQNSPKFRVVLLRSARLFSDRLNDILAQYQLNYSMWQLIYHIYDHDSITSIDLAHELNVSKPSIAKRINTLHKLDVIQFLESSDKRQKLIQLTEKGRDLYQICTIQIDQFEQQFLNQVNPEDIAQSAETLQLFLSILEHYKSLNIVEEL